MQGGFKVAKESEANLCENKPSYTNDHTFWLSCQIVNVLKITFKTLIIKFLKKYWD